MVFDHVMAVLGLSLLEWCRGNLSSYSLLCENGQTTKDEERNKSHIEEEKEVEITSQVA